MILPRYTPGDYIQKCTICGDEMIADKRASACPTCMNQTVREQAATIERQNEELATSRESELLALRNNERMRAERWHCNICGGEVDLSNATKPTVDVGVGRPRTSLNRTPGEDP